MTKFDIDTVFVRKLAELLKDTGLNEIEYAEGDRRIRCVASPAQTPVVQMAPTAAPQTTVVSTPTEAKSAAPAGAPITAPMVGTVYLAPEPGAAPFVKIGDKVKAGDTLLIIEAMKVMNPIKASKAGTIAEILTADAKPVEFGETLMLVA